MLTGDPKAADPCALMDPGPLRQFGPSSPEGYLLEGCERHIDSPHGDATLQVYFDTKVNPRGDFGPRAQQLGGLTIVRDHNSGVASFCQDRLVLADGTQIWIKSNNDELDPYAITEVGTATAVTKLVQNGITYRSNRTAGVALARSDACTLLDGTALRTVPNLAYNRFIPGFAHWSCTWGFVKRGQPLVSVEFRQDRGGVSPEEYDNPTTIADQLAWTHIDFGNPNAQRCSVFVEYRPASHGADPEIVETDVDAPAPIDEQCAQAKQLATAVEAKLPPAS